MTLAQIERRLRDLRIELENLASEQPQSERLVDAASYVRVATALLTAHRIVEEMENDTEKCR